MDWGKVIMKFLWGLVAGIIGLLITALTQGAQGLPAGTDPISIVLRWIAVAIISGIVLALKNITKHIIQ